MVMNIHTQGENGEASEEPGPYRRPRTALGKAPGYCASLALATSTAGLPSRLVTPASEVSRACGLALIQALAATSGFWLPLSTASISAFSISRLNTRLLSNLPTLAHSWT